MAKLGERLARRIARKFGYQLVAKDQLPGDFQSGDRAIFQLVRPYTMTTPERIYSLLRAVEYTVAHQIPGAIVECGVWRGGSMLAIAKKLIQLEDTERDLYLFDTFEGMNKPVAEDGQVANEKFEEMRISDDSSTWANAGLEQVKQLMESSGYPMERIHFIKGKVEDSLPQFAPEQIGLLRLDTDWYESTKHELVHLYPKLSQYGVMILDDYGHWPGAKKATDEYFAENKVQFLLNRIDKSARIGVKVAPFGQC